MRKFITLLAMTVLITACTQQPAEAQFKRKAVEIKGDTPYLSIEDIDASANEKIWRHNVSGSTYQFQMVDDTNSSRFVWSIVRQSGIDNPTMVLNTEWLDVRGTLALSKGGDLASATTLLLDNDGNYFDVTGTTDIEAIASDAGVSVPTGTQITLQFDGVLDLIHDGVGLVLPGGANITTTAGDVGIFVEYHTARWKCVSWQSSLVGAGGDVTGPAGATATSVPRFDASGKVLDESTMTIADTTGIVTLGGTSKSIIPDTDGVGNIGNNTNAFDEGWFTGDVYVGRLIAGGGDPTFPTTADVGIIGEKVGDAGELYLKDLGGTKTFGSAITDGTLLESDDGVFTVYGMSYSGTKTSALFSIDQNTGE